MSIMKPKGITSFLPQLNMNIVKRWTVKRLANGKNETKINKKNSVSSVFMFLHSIMFSCYIFMLPSLFKSIDLVRRHFMLIIVL